MKKTSKKIILLVFVCAITSLIFSCTKEENITINNTIIDSSKIKSYYFEFDTLQTLPYKNIAIANLDTNSIINVSMIIGDSISINNIGKYTNWTALPFNGSGFIINHTLNITYSVSFEKINFYVYTDNTEPVRCLLKINLYTK